MTLREAAAAFNVGLHVLRRAIRAGSLPSYRIGNGRIRVRASDIERVIEASRTGGAK
jgi:excisionase family DNA binding protein